MRKLTIVAMSLGALAGAPLPVWAQPEGALSGKLYLETDGFSGHLHTAEGTDIYGMGAAQRAGVALNWHDWLVNGELGHQRAGFSLSDGPLPGFEPDVWEGEALLGYRLHWGAWTLAPGLGYRWWRWDSHRARAAEHHPLLDGDETEQTLGPALQAQLPLPDHYELDAQTRLYLGDATGEVIELQLARPIGHGLIPSLGYRLEIWSSHEFSERVHLLVGRLSYGWEPAEEHADEVRSQVPGPAL